jgi:hypothetical protein
MAALDPSRRPLRGLLRVRADDRAARVSYFFAGVSVPRSIAAVATAE